LNKKLIYLFAVLVLGLFIAGCSGSVGKKVYPAAPELVIYPAVPEPVNLEVSIGGATGTVVSNPIGIFCGNDANVSTITNPANDCLYAYDLGTNVILTATPGPGHIFTGWSEACSGTNPVCNLVMNSSKYVDAHFL